MEGGGREDIIDLRTTAKGAIMLMRLCGAHKPQKAGSRCIKHVGGLKPKLLEQLQEGQGTDPIRLNGNMQTNQTIK